MPTIREIICDAGVSTLREYMCLENIGEGIVVNTEVNFIIEAQADQISDFDQTIKIKEDQTIIKIEDMAIDTISEADQQETITEAEEEIIYEV